MNEMTTSAPAKRTSQSLLPGFGGSMTRLRDEIDRLFDDFAAPTRSLFNFEPRASLPVPAIELKEAEKGYTLTAELPGLAPEDIDLQITDGLLTLSGEKKEEQERKHDGYVMSERRYGSFRRQIALPTDVDAAGIKADFKNGLLTLTLPKDEKAVAHTRKIEIAKS